ncbi:MAG: ISAs1 family transposase [Rhodocyclaceae bacterium]|nr:ISAs1 family transposase [Rhodocyclaceae bacterium]
MASLAKILQEIPDPRCGNARRHELLDILTIVLVASVCGAETCVDFADFARFRQPLLREFLRLDNGLPSHDTFSRVFRMLEPEAFGQAFAAFLDDLGAGGEGVLAIDGKTLRRSFDRAAGRSALHVVTAFGAGARVSIGQRAVAEGENEITAARALLGLLSLEGQMVTGDAIHAQAATAQIVLERGGDYLFALKANRPAMLGEVATFFADPPDALPMHETVDADHGRIEIRRHWVTHSTDWISGDRAEPGAPVMPGLATLACVEASRDGAPPVRRYYLSSAVLTPEQFARAVRAHWAIENSLHWVLDVTFDEDRARARKDNGPENLAILRRLALNVLQKSRKDMSIARKRKSAGWSDDFARSVIGQMR